MVLLDDFDNVDIKAVNESEICDMFRVIVDSDQKKNTLTTNPLLHLFFNRSTQNGKYRRKSPNRKFKRI